MLLKSSWFYKENNTTKLNMLKIYIYSSGPSVDLWGTPRAAPYTKPNEQLNEVN